MIKTTYPYIRYPQQGVLYNEFDGYIYCAGSINGLVVYSFDASAPIGARFTLETSDNSIAGAYIGLWVDKNWKVHEVTERI